MTEKIQKIAKGVFKLFHSEVAEVILTLDFTPIIHVFKLTPPFCLLHWQARPKYYRKYGVYDASRDEYLSVKFDELFIECNPRVLQVDDKSTDAIPSAVLLFDKAVTHKISDKITIGLIV